MESVSGKVIPYNFLPDKQSDFFIRERGGARVVITRGDRIFRDSSPG